MSGLDHDTASALVDALACLRQAQRAVDGVLQSAGFLIADTPPRRISARQTGLEILNILSDHPLTLPQIARDLCDLRNDVDCNRKAGGTRYQEIARAALTRLLARGLVQKIETRLGDGIPLFERV